MSKQVADRLAQPCALTLRDGCSGTTRGVDPCRVCESCQRKGQPSRVAYSVVIGREAAPVDVAVDEKLGTGRYT